MINKSDALTHSGDWRGELQVCIAYEDAAGKRYDHVPRNEAVRKTLRPVYRNYPGWSEDISTIRHFAELPMNARRYVAGMMKAVLDVAYAGEKWPAADKLPNLRYLGVGPEPSQIIKDVPSAAELIKLV
jgi:adenylosuccinate synthase